MKRSLDDLALFGGTPAFAAPLHVGTPNFGDEEAFLTRVRRILSSRRFTNDGPLVRELEERIAELTGAPHAVATCNATAALQLLAHALDVQGDVVMPAFTFVATAHAFAWVRARPVFCDIEPTFHGVDPVSMAAYAGAECRALVGVHTWGVPCDVVALEGLARTRGVPLVLDAAHALGCALGERPVGTFGTAEVFSLHATKVVSSFEGGMITTRDPALAHELRLRRDFGFDDYDHVATLGTNAKLSELHAAAGLTTLEALPSLVAENLRCFERYRTLLGEIPALRLVDVATRGRSNHQYIVCVLDPSATPVTRDTLVCVLHAEGVRARRYFHPGCHRSAPYTLPGQPLLPVTERVADTVLVLPTGPSVGDEAIAGIAGVLGVALENGAEVARRR